jgi:hypothetical protein
MSSIHVRTTATRKGLMIPVLQQCADQAYVATSLPLCSPGHFESLETASSRKQFEFGSNLQRSELLGLASP